MKTSVSLESLLVGSIYTHILGVFGCLGGDARKEIPGPPPDMPFEVVEPIETCHPCCGLGLQKIDRRNCLPVGRYQVETWEDDRGSHKLYLQNLDSGERVWCFYGSDDRSLCMDWRGVQKAA